MNPQVFTMTKSAPSGSDTSMYPSSVSAPSIRSLSTRFLGQPRLTKAYVPFAAPGDSAPGADSSDGTGEDDRIGSCSMAGVWFGADDSASPRAEPTGPAKIRGPAVYRTRPRNPPPVPPFFRATIRTVGTEAVSSW